MERQNLVNELKLMAAQVEQGTLAPEDVPERMEAIREEYRLGATKKEVEDLVDELELAG